MCGRARTLSYEHTLAHTLKSTHTHPTLHRESGIPRPTYTLSKFPFHSTDGPGQERGKYIRNERKKVNSREAQEKGTKANKNLDDEQADEFRKKKNKEKQNLSKKGFTKSCPPKR